MEAIKKKMQAMKLEKDNAVDRAETAEQHARDANLRAEKVILAFNLVPLPQTCRTFDSVWRGSASSTEEDPTNWEWVGSGAGAAGTG